MPTPVPPEPSRAGARVAVLVPVKAFDLAKHRLADALRPDERRELAIRLATGVLRAAAPLPVFVLCEDDEVEAWAQAHGASVLRGHDGGLNNVVQRGIDALAAAGYTSVCVAHADLPAARAFAHLTTNPGVTLVPDRHRDGTNVLCIPTTAGFRVAYGPGSFARHVAHARHLGLEVTVVHDPALAWDVDTSDDLAESDARYPAPAGGQDKKFTMQIDLPLPRRALAIAAHPDDVEFQCGATFAKWAKAGCELHHLICTDGSKGSWDPCADTDTLVATRVREQRAAADALGSRGTVRFLGAIDGELEHTRTHVGAIARIIRELKPDVVLAHDPWRRWRLHPDHRSAGFLSCDAVVAARDPHFFPEHGLAPHRPQAMLLFECEEPDHAEDVTGHEAAKIAALLAHVSQFETTMDIAAPHDDAGRAAFGARIRAELADAGRPVGLASAELFRRLRDV